MSNFVLSFLGNFFLENDATKILMTHPEKLHLKTIQTNCLLEQHVLGNFFPFAKTG
jgi:hypothetical protein